MTGFITQFSWTVVQMLIIAGLMFRASRLPMSAAQRLLVWRMGFLIMACLPWLQPQLALIQLPWLPVNEPSIGQTYASPAVSAVIPVAEQAVFTAAQWWLLAWLSISAVLILRWCKRLYLLHHITRQSPQVTAAHWQHTATRCQQRLGLARLPVLRTNDTLNTPCTWGFIKPVILLPSRVSDEPTLKIILLHEMAHIKRRDWLWMSLIELITLLFWFNPFLWWIRRLLINGFETACDDLVMQQDIKPSAYAETLLRFHQRQQHTPVAVMMAEHSALYHRLTTILTPPTRSLAMNPKKQTLITASVLALMTLTGFTQLTQAHPDESAVEVPQPDTVSTPQPVDAPDPQVESYPVPPVAPAAITSPHPEHMPSAPAKPHGHPSAPKPPAAVSPDHPSLHIQEQRLHEIQQRLQVEERRLKQMHKESREAIRTQLRDAERDLHRAQQRQTTEHRRANLARREALEAREQHLNQSTEARLRAAERVLHAQQQRLDLERLKMQEQQEKMQRRMDQAERRSANR